MPQLTPQSLAEAVNRLGGEINQRRWRLAELALQARRQNLPSWADIIANCPTVMVEPRTVMDWARTQDFRERLSRHYDLPYSHYSRAARFLDRLPLAVIEDALADAEANRIGLLSFAAHLTDLARPTPKAFSLADWLADEIERTRRAQAECWDEDALAALRRVEDALDAELARLIPVTP